MKAASLALFSTLPLICGPVAAQPAAGAPPPAAGRGAFPSVAATLAGQMLTQGDSDADQRLSAREFAALTDGWFDALDPDRTGRVRQEEFAQKFESVLPPPAAGGRRGGGIGPGRGPNIAGTTAALGLFAAGDQNRDGALERAEWQRAARAWFAAWDTARQGALARAELARGLNLVLPRTNMGAAGGAEAGTARPALPTPPPSPPLPPAEAQATLRIVDGFRIELAASEPMVEDPVALTFDEDGRAYVVELRSFMLDIERTGEREPLGRITRLEDTDGDGRFDRSTVFIDQLIVPRAVAAIAGGILYVSDYQLHFARDTDGDGRADHTELVDPDYGRGNIEHAPNALFRAMDNWIYNGESPFRYRVIGGTLVRQTTEFRGQWGMAQDNHGRLIYNVNNSQLMGDFTPPNYFSRNANHPATSGLGLFVATDQRTFPLRMTTAINRGDAADVLDAQGRAYVFASSCGPVIYRGDNFPPEFAGNAFVCDPALNLVKRNLVSDRDLTLTATQAYPDREFLASTDERFRPSSLYNGPDGALWLVDMYRGITQHGQFMTPYLRRETLARGLDKGIHFGRIYRITAAAKPAPTFPRLSREDSATLVARLASPNGWVRDTAQRLLIERGGQSAAPALAQLVAQGKDSLARIHALWTLEGLFTALPEAAPAPEAGRALKLHAVEAGFAPVGRDVPAAVLQACLAAVADSDAKVQAAALRVTEALTAGNTAGRHALHAAIEKLGGQTAGEAWFQAALTAGNLPKPESLPLLARILSRDAGRLLLRDAVLSGLRGWELPFLQVLLTDPQWSTRQGGRTAALQALASALFRERDATKIGLLFTLAAGQGTEQAWRRLALLEGFVAGARGRPAHPIPFSAEPATLASLAVSPDSAVRQQAERIKPLLAWPGHQSEAIAGAAVAPALSNSESVRIKEGEVLFQQLCAGCHGLTGQGLTPLAPPLVNSEWVRGSPSRLVRILLHGMSGPVTVDGTTFRPPQILPEMPPLASVGDAQLAAILSYIRRAWGHTAAPIPPEAIAAVRAETTDRKNAWTEAQLLEIN